MDSNFADDGDGASDFDWEYRFTGRSLDVDTGLDYYRARYYHPTLGRFVGRDPVQRQANLYRYCGNGPLINTDPSGLVWALYDIPKSGWKCGIVAFALSLGSAMDKSLFGSWLYDDGAPRELNAFGFYTFDPDGSERSDTMRLMYALALTLSRDLKCGESGSENWNQSWKPIPAGKTTNMISNWQFAAECTYTAEKECDEKGCCKGIKLSASCSFHARDRVDFWPDAPNTETGENMFGIGGIMIADRLVRACFPTGRGFVLTSNAPGNKSWTAPCK